MKKSILITGATGYLGGHLTNTLSASGYSIVLLTRANSQYGRIKTNVEAIYKIEDNGILKAFQNHHIESVFHCATDYGRKNNDPLRIIDANLILPLQILQTGKQYGLKVFLNIDTLLDRTVSPYALSKGQFNEWLQLLGKEIVAINIALEHFYGAGDDTSKFISMLIDSVLNQVPSIPLTAGEQKRDFIFINDVLSAMITILDWSKAQSNAYYHFEVGTGINTPIKEMVTRIATEANYNTANLNFGAIPYRPNEVMESKVNLTAIAQLGWKPKTNLQEGLRLVISEEKKIRGLI